MSRLSDPTQSGDGGASWAAKLHERKLEHQRRSMPIRVLFAIAGFVVLAGGIVAIPFPGPGWAIVFVGLGMLALEFTWAERLALLVLKGLQAFYGWWGRAPLWQKAIAVLALALVVAGALYLSARSLGIL